MTWLIEYFDIHEGCNKTRRVYVPYAETAVSIVNKITKFLYGIPAPIMGMRELEPVVFDKTNTAVGEVEI